jgi:hypothetical protein
MSWRAQNRSKDAKTPSASRGRSRKPKPALCGIQPYARSLTYDREKLTRRGQHANTESTSKGRACLG